MNYDLDCRYDARQSFYGKAKVEEKEYKDFKEYNLYSYGTLVAYIEEYEDKVIYKYLGKYSQTTTRHQKEFFKQNGLSDKQIKDLFKYGELVIMKEFELCI